MKPIPLYESAEKKYSLSVFMDDWKQEDELDAQVEKFLKRNPGYESIQVDNGDDNIWIVVTNFKQIDRKKLEKQMDFMPSKLKFDSQEELNKIVSDAEAAEAADSDTTTEWYNKALERFSEPSLQKAVKYVEKTNVRNGKFDYKAAQKKTGLKSGISIFDYGIWYLLNKYDSDKELQKIVKPIKA